MQDIVYSEKNAIHLIRKETSSCQEQRTVGEYTATENQTQSKMKVHGRFWLLVNSG